MGIYDNCIKKTKLGNFLLIDKELEKQMNKLIDSINESSHLPIRLLSKYKENAIPEHDLFVHNFMSRDYYHNDYSIFFNGYPTDEHPYHLTTIEITSDKYNVLGISLKSSKEEIYQKLAEFGFEYIGSDFNWSEHSFYESLSNLSEDEKIEKIKFHCKHSNKAYFKNLDVNIGVEFMDDEVFGIVLDVKTYYLGNCLY
jgi:hypothetical protein